MNATKLVWIKRSIIGSMLSLSAVMFLAAPALAQGPLAPLLGDQFGQVTDQQLGLQYGSATGLTNQDPRFTIAFIIRAGLGVLGVVALVIVVIAGFTWMTAGGNEEKITEAKHWLIAGVIGLAIILSAYSIASFIVNQLVQATVR